MVTPRLAILGDGRMGRAIEGRAADHGYDVVGVFGRRATDEARGGSAGAGNTEIQEALARSDVALEVSTPDSAVANALLCVEAGCPVVVGTTGWTDDEGRLAEAVETHGGALLYAPNFALGVALVRILCARLGPWLAQMPDFDAAMIEIHHTGKRDAPSGTARMLADVLEETSGRVVPVTSVRTGFVPGTHEIAIDGPYERVVVRHEARDRAVFADGALRAATWLRGRRGMWTLEQMFDDMIDGDEEG